MSRRKNKGPPRDYPSADSKAWLYLIGRPESERGPASIKIGITSDPAKRMKQHASGHGITWQHFCASGPRGLMLEIERAATKTLAGVGKQRAAPFGEEFYGVSRADAERIIRVVADNVRANFAGFIECKARYQAEARAWRIFRSRLTEAA